MKPAKQWVDENSQSGAFDLVYDCKQAEILVKSIQDDAAAGSCSADTALLIFRHLEYYRNFIPFILNISESEYAQKQEAKGVDMAIARFLAETGETADPKPR